MQRRITLLTVITLMLVLLLGVGVVQAQESENYNVMINSWAGGNYGGGTLSSASYTLVVSMGSHIQVHSTSAGYELCSGFICQLNAGFAEMHLPVLSKSPTD